MRQPSLDNATPKFCESCKSLHPRPFLSIKLISILKHCTNFRTKRHAVVTYWILSWFESKASLLPLPLSFLFFLLISPIWLCSSLPLLHLHKMIRILFDLISFSLSDTFNLCFLLPILFVLLFKRTTLKNSFVVYLCSRQFQFIFIYHSPFSLKAPKGSTVGKLCSCLSI